MLQRTLRAWQVVQAIAERFLLRVLAGSILARHRGKRKLETRKTFSDTDMESLVGNLTNENCPYVLGPRSRSQIGRFFAGRKRRRSDCGIAPDCGFLSGGLRGLVGGNSKYFHCEVAV